MPEIIDPNQIDVLVTCKTKGCENSNITIPVRMNPDGQVLCGVCGVKIKAIEPSPYV